MSIEEQLREIRRLRGRESDRFLSRLREKLEDSYAAKAPRMPTGSALKERMMQLALLEIVESSQDTAELASELRRFHGSSVDENDDRRREVVERMVQRDLDRVLRDTGAATA